MLGSAPANEGAELLASSPVRFLGNCRNVFGSFQTGEMDFSSTTVLPGEIRVGELRE
jgi:hypothetical protein